jgi:hypothetical protein
MEEHDNPSRFRLLATLGVLCCISVAPSTAQTSETGRIIGHIDGVFVDDGGAHVRGWACQQGRPESIGVHIYANNAPTEATKSILGVAGKADLDSEAAVDAVCKDTVGRQHRFDVPLPGAVLLNLHGMRLFVHGIRVVGTVENAAINGSGTVSFPDAPPVRKAPTSYPPVTGSYVSLKDHPRVFDTSADLQDIARRANTPGTFTAERFGGLAARVGQHLGAKVDWEATYAGCDVEIYLRGYAFEQKPAYGNDRSEEALATAMQVRSGLAPPHGAAIVAARAALYAALVQAGAKPPARGPTADAASSLAKRIVLAWADHGFRDDAGAFRNADEKYCDLDPDGKAHTTQFGTFVGALTHARGVIYSVHAQDLLEGIGAVTPAEQAQMDMFHRNMFDVIRSINNAQYGVSMKWRYSDETYNNQFATHLVALLSIARLLDDGENLKAVLDGGKGSRTVKLPWIELFDHIIYGPNDTPLLNITPNSSVDPVKSHPGYQTAIVAAGEINDRYRHSNPSQGMGYPMGSLEALDMAAEILRNSGLDAYGYRSAHGQSIEMATQYYACFAKYAGFAAMVTKDNSRQCPDARQYWGMVVNAVQPNILIGAYRFPQNQALTELEVPARAAFVKSSASLEPILFGKWRDAVGSVR